MTATIGDAERGRLARSGALSFAGSAISALMGFALTLILARLLGDAGSGVVLQSIALFTIALSVARLGMDSAAVWILPRLRTGDTASVRSVALFHLAVSCGGGVLVMIVFQIAATVLSRDATEEMREVLAASSAIAWFLPAASMLLVGLAITRGLGGVRTYIAVGSIALPTIRTLATAVISLAGGSLVAVSLGWAVPQVPALVAAVGVAWWQVRRAEDGAAGGWRVPRELRRSIRGYALPRTLSAILEQSLIWLDVVIVGAVAGSAAAGVYGGASRFVMAGFIVDTALRVVVSPRFSQLLHSRSIGELEALYRVAATWLTLMSTPIYIMLAIFAPVVLSWLGPEFLAGEGTLVILCVGAIITFLAGNVQSVLLMSGHSGIAATNKAVVIVVNVVANLLLIPAMGIEGAALAWAVSMVLDAVLATIEVRTLVGVNPRLGSVLYAAAIPALSFGVPALAARALWGAGLPQLILSGLVGAALFCTWCAFDRSRLHLSGIGRTVGR